MASSDVLNTLSGGVGRRARSPFWVGAFAFLVVAAVVGVALMSAVAIGVLATLRVTYTTSIDRAANVVSSTERKLADPSLRLQTVTALTPGVLPSEASTRPSTPAEASGAALLQGSPSSSETPQPPSTATAPAAAEDAPSAAGPPADETSGAALTRLIEAQSPPPTVPSDDGDEGRATATSPASTPSTGSGAVASPASPTDATPSAESSAGDVAASAGAPETDEIGRLATAPLPIAVTAAALSHLRHALKRRAQARAIKHTVHKPATHTAPQDANFRPFDPFQPAAATASQHQRTW